MTCEPEQWAPAATAMQDAAVNTMYLHRSRSSMPILSSKEKAKGAVLYHYKHAATGFSVKVAPSRSTSEGDVNKSIKYNAWGSTPNGNKKLDAAYQEAKKIQ